MNLRWEVAVAPSSVGFQEMSFVKSIATAIGVDQVVSKLIEVVKKKSGVTIKTSRSTHICGSSATACW